MADYFRDTFTGTNGTDLTAHTPDTGTGWTEIWEEGGSNTEIQSNEAVPAGGSLGDGVVVTADATYSSADYKVFADNITVDNSDDYTYIMARLTDIDNFYAIQYSDDTFTLYKKVSGTWTQLDDETVTFPVDTDTVQLRVQGTSIKGYINGVEYLSSTDSAISATGEAALGFGGGSELQDTDGDVSGQTVTEFYVTDFATSYPGAIADAGAEHHWDFDGDSTDQIGSVNGTDTSILYTGGAIAEDATNCATTNAVGDRVSLPTTSNINNSAQDRKAVGGWFETSAINTPPKRIYGEGTNTTAFQFVMAYGNNLMLETVEPTNFTVQVFGPVMQPGRTYHLLGVFRGNTQGNTVELYVDGVAQTLKEPSDGQPDNIQLDARGVGEFGDPAGTVGVGGDVVILNAPLNGLYNHWATWNGTTVENLTAAVIREELFEKGALPTTTITAGTEAAMQTSLDALADTVRVDSPLCIRVSEVTGDGDVSLDADNITFDPLASIHVQYMGTGTLTWRNENGGDASVGSTPNGGTIIFATPQTLTVTVNDAATGTAIENARVYIEADTGGDLAAGTVIMSALTNASGIATVTHDYTTDQPIIGYARQGTSSTYYKQGALPATLTSSALDTTVLLVKDE